MSDILHQAARQGNVSELSTLLEGRDPNGFSQSGLSPLHCAATSTNTAVVDLLLEKGAQIDQQAERDSVYDGYSAVHFASERSSSAPVLKHLLEKGAADDLKDALGRFPLHVACLKGNLAGVEILTSRYALRPEAINTKDVHGRTALMLACSQGHAHVVHHLLRQKEVVIDDVDQDGNTALHHCFQVQSQQLFNYNYPLLDGHYLAAFEMVKAGALLEIRNNDSDAALDVIHESLAELLEVVSKEREKLSDIEGIEELLTLEENELRERGIGAEVIPMLLNAIGAYSKVMERELALKKARGSCPFIDSSAVPEIRKFRGMDLSQFRRPSDFSAGALKPNHQQFSEYQGMGKGAEAGVCPMGFVGEKPSDHSAFMSLSAEQLEAIRQTNQRGSSSLFSPSSLSSVALPLSLSLLAAGAAFFLQRYWATRA